MNTEVVLKVFNIYLAFIVYFFIKIVNVWSVNCYNPSQNRDYLLLVILLPFRKHDSSKCRFQTKNLNNLFSKIIFSYVDHALTKLVYYLTRTRR